MQGLLTAYTVYLNRRHDRHGHLMDGRYKAKLVEGDRCLPALSRYVHLNPAHVKAVRERALPEQVKYVRGYRWSSYAGYIGRGKPLEFVTYGPILAMMAGRKQERPARYGLFVENGLAEKDEEFAAQLTASSRSIGSEAFRVWVDQLYQAQMGRRTHLADISFRRTAEPLAAAVILGVVAEVLGEKVDAFRRRRRDSRLRAIAARFLIRNGGLSQPEAARVLHAGSGAAISKQLSRFAAGASTEKRVMRQCKTIEQQLEGLRQIASSGAAKSQVKG